MSTEENREFFNKIVSEYDELIKKHIPLYGDIFWTIFHYLPQNFNPKNILELGCGTGNLTKPIYDKYKNANITAVDAAEEMLKTTKKRLPNVDLKLIESPFESLCFNENSFDLIVSNLAIHHLVDEEKEKLFHHIYRWLKPNGLFVLADVVRAVSDVIYQSEWEDFNKQNLENGITEEELKKLNEHAETCDHYATVPNLLNYLSNAKFKNVDILWRCSFWAVFHAEK